jgi:cold shock CspA family protein
MQLKNNRGQLAKWFNNFGFIKFENRDVFVHRENYLPGFLPEVGQIVAFDFGLSPNPNRPPQAINVRVVKSAATIQAEEQIRAGLEALQKQQGGTQ